MPSSTTTATPLNILSLGGSRNIGYYSALKLLKTGATVTFLLRNSSIFDADTAIQPYLSSGQVRRVKGDALVKDDVARAWAEAARERTKIDYLIFTVGGTPRFAGLSKGFVIDPPNLVTQCLLNALCTLPSLPQQPRILAITAAGITPTSHASLPFVVKPLFKHFVAGPHADKLGVEKVLHYVTAGWPSWNSSTDGEPPAEVLPSGWERTTDGLPEPSSLRHVMVLRPSILLDGESLGDKYDDAENNNGKGKKTKAPYRVSAEADLGGYTVSRKDVAHFVVDVVLNRWDAFENKIVNISY